MISSLLFGALNAVSKSQLAFLSRALGFGDTFDVILDESLGVLGVWIQPPEVPKPYYGLDEGVFVSFFKSRLRYLYLVFFLTLGIFCIFHYLYRCRHHNKRIFNTNNPSPKSVTNETAERGVQTFYPIISDSMCKQISHYEGQTINGVRHRLSRTRLTRTAIREERRSSPIFERSGSSSQKVTRKGRKMTVLTKLRSETTQPTPPKTPPSKHRAILLSRNASYTMRKAKPKIENPSPPWIGNSVNTVKKPNRPIDTIPYIIKKSPRRNESLEKTKKNSKRRKLRISPSKVKDVLNCNSSPKHYRLKSRRPKKSFSPTRAGNPKMKLKPEYSTRKAPRDSKRCKTCKKIRPYPENQTPDYASIFDTRRQGCADSLFCFNPAGQFNSMYTRTRMNGLNRGSIAVSAVLTGNDPPENDHKKSTGEDTNMNKTLLRQEAKLASGNKLLLTTTSANRSVNNILLHPQQACPNNTTTHYQHEMEYDYGENGISVDKSKRLFNGEFNCDVQQHTGVYGRHYHVSRYEKYHNNIETIANQKHNVTKLYSENVTSANNDDSQENNILPRCETFGKVVDTDNNIGIQHLEKERLCDGHTLFGSYGDVDTHHLERSGNLFPQRLLQRRAQFSQQRMMLNTEKTNKEDTDVGLAGGQHGVGLQAGQMVNDRETRNNHFRGLMKSSSIWLDTKRPELTTKRIIKIKSNKWRFRPKPYIHTSRSYRSMKSPDFSDITFTRSTDSSKVIESNLASCNKLAEATRAEQHDLSCPNILPISSISQTKQQLRNIPDLSTNTVTSTVNSPLNKNNCSPSRLNKTNLNKNIANSEEKQPSLTTMTSNVISKPNERHLRNKSISPDVTSKDRETRSRTTQYRDKVDSAKKLKNPPNRDISLSRRPSPFRLIQKKMRSVSETRKSATPFRSPKLTKPSVPNITRRKGKLERINNENRLDTLMRFDEQDGELPYDNVVSLGIQTSVTSLRNTSVQTSPVEEVTLLTTDKPPEKNMTTENRSLQTDGIQNKDLEVNDILTSPTQSNTDNQKARVKTDKTIDVKGSSSAVNSDIVKDKIPLCDVTRASSFVIGEQQVISKTADVVNLHSKYYVPPRHPSLQHRSSSCSRTAERMSSCGSSPVSVLLDGHAWMGRPRWEDANIEEVNRRVERALKLRQELQKNKKGRLVRNSSYEPVVKSPPCIAEEHTEVDTYYQNTHTSHPHGIINRESLSHGPGMNIGVFDTGPNLHTGFRMEAKRGIQNGATLYNDNLQQNSCEDPNARINRIRITNDHVGGLNMPDHSNSNRKSLLTGGQKDNDDSETTDTIGKTLPFNTDRAESDFLHPLSSDYESTPGGKRSRAFKVDTTTDNRSSPDSTIGASGGRSPKQCQSYHGDIRRNLVNTVRVVPASAATSISTHAEDILNNESYLKASKVFTIDEGSNKNSPPIKISKTENTLQSEYPKCVGELVHALPHVPLASFVEWFIETSYPGQFVGYDHSASPVDQHVNLESKNNSSSDRTNIENSPFTLMKLNRRQNHSKTLEKCSDGARVEMPLEITAGDGSDNNVNTLSESLESNVYDTNDSNIMSYKDQTTQQNCNDDDIENKTMKTSIRRIWLTRESSKPCESSSDALSDNEKLQDQYI